VQHRFLGGGAAAVEGAIEAVARRRGGDVPAARLALHGLAQPPLEGDVVAQVQGHGAAATPTEERGLDE
jgi:hypothetical protein